MIRIKQEPFCVIRYKVRAFGEESNEWGIAYSPSKEDLSDISKKEANEVIQRYGLVESLRCEDGILYDTPNGDFYNKFKDHFKMRYKHKK